MTHIVAVSTAIKHAMSSIDKRSRRNILEFFAFHKYSSKLPWNMKIIVVRFGWSTSPRRSNYKIHNLNDLGTFKGPDGWLFDVLIAHHTHYIHRDRPWQRNEVHNDQVDFLYNKKQVKNSVYIFKNLLF